MWIFIFCNCANWIFLKHSYFYKLVWMFSEDSDQLVRLHSLIILRHTLYQLYCFRITKTRLYIFDPLKPHFYIVKLGFTGVYIIFLIFAQKHRLWYSLEPPRRGGSNEYPQSIFWAEIWKYQNFFIWKCSFLVGKCSIYLNRRVFVMLRPDSTDWSGCGMRRLIHIFTENTFFFAGINVILPKTVKFLFRCVYCIFKIQRVFQYFQKSIINHS